jgi:hypothetical protein
MMLRIANQVTQNPNLMLMNPTDPFRSELARHQIDPSLYFSRETSNVDSGSANAVREEPFDGSVALVSSSHVSGCR